MSASSKLPVLYSFRRCPYAMRARLALYAAQISLELREVVLKHKPQELIDCSPKATVPVLVLFDPKPLVIDESLDIMRWAFGQADPCGYLKGLSSSQLAAQEELLLLNDGEFKSALDQYKYFDRFPEHDQLHYRAQAEQFLIKLEDRLAITPYLLGDTIKFIDLAVFPFVRQFAQVDREWFSQSRTTQLTKWLEGFLSSAEFGAVMGKYPAYVSAGKGVEFPSRDV